MKTKTAPHSIPYQGSKRNLAAEILRYFPPKFATLVVLFIVAMLGESNSADKTTTLYESFAGSAAITIAAAANELGDYIIRR